MVKWSELNGLANAQQIDSALRKVITPESYGKGEGMWTLTDLLQERSAHATRARRIIEGIDTRGETVGMGQMVGADGPLRFRLKVLTRQACMETADGTSINWWDTTATETIEETGELTPEERDKPLPGDKVGIKGNMITHDPETGMYLTRAGKQSMIARKSSELGREAKSIEALSHWRKVAVDQDGCITVGYLDAVQLLSTKGKRISSPQHTTRARRNNSDVKTRRITNWHFEEVPLDYRAPKKRTSKKAQEKVATPEPTV